MRRVWPMPRSLTKCYGSLTRSTGRRCVLIDKFSFITETTTHCIAPHRAAAHHITSRHTTPRHTTHATPRHVTTPHSLSCPPLWGWASHEIITLRLHAHARTHVRTHAHTGESVQHMHTSTCTHTHTYPPTHTPPPSAQEPSDGSTYGCGQHRTGQEWTVLSYTT